MPIAEEQVPGSIGLVTFESRGSRLLGTIFTADGRGSRPTLLLLHGFPGTDRNLDLAHAIRRAGWNVFIFHYRGAWGSEGDFSFGNAVEDAAAAIAFLRLKSTAEAYRIDASRLATAGHSMGGFVSLMAASQDPGIVAAGSWAGFNFGAFFETIDGRANAIAHTEAAWGSQLAPLRGTSGPALVAEVLAAGRRWNLLGTAGYFQDRPTLLVAASRDDVAPHALHHDPLVAAYIDAGARVTSAIEDTDHGFTDKRLQLGNAIVTWLAAI